MGIQSEAGLRVSGNIFIPQKNPLPTLKFFKFILELVKNDVLILTALSKFLHTNVQVMN